MIRKFAAVLVLMLLAGAKGYAQDAPAGQQPAQQPAGQPAAQPTAQTPASSSQENPDEESTSRRKSRPHDYRNWQYNVGGGGNLPSGNTSVFVKGGGGVVAGGAARNFNRYFGLRLDGMWADLPLRTTALQAAQAPGGSDHVIGVTLGPIFNIPVTKKYSGFVVIGPGFFHRSGELDSSTFVPGSACNSFWSWWGACFNGSVRLSGKFLNSSENQFGLNFGGGVARKVRGNLEIYGEVRYVHGKHNGVTTDLKPITVGVRW